MSLQSHCRVAALLAALAPLSPLLANEVPPARPDAASAPPTTMETFTVEESATMKTHTLFMGADIALNLDRDLYHVHDVLGSNWVIQIAGRDHVVSAKQAPLNLKITPTLKLTESSATISGFTRTKAYSYANDPSVLLTRAMTQSAVRSTEIQAIANQAQARSDTANNSALGGAAVAAGSDNQFSDSAIMAVAQYGRGANLQPSTTTSTLGNTVNPLYDPSQDLTGAGALKGIFRNDNSVLNNGIVQNAATAAASQTANGDEPTGKIATNGLDAIDVDFDVQAGKPLPNPYVVTMTRFHAPGAKVGLVQNLVYAQSLHPIDRHASHVHFSEEGFPVGFEVVDFQLHLYNRGVEIATNLAANRVELTRDEAFEYLKMEYLGAHLHDTLPATPAMGRMPAELPAALAAGRYRQSFYVRVSKGGLADEAYSDPACTRLIADPLLESVVKRVRFKPALAAGVPVEGVATLNLNQLAI